MAVDDAADDVGEVGLWFDADELAGLDQGSDGRPVLGPAVGAGEECILPIEGNRGVILPISGRKSRFTTDGTHFTGERFAAFMVRSVLQPMSSSSKENLARRLSWRHGCLTPRVERRWRSVPLPFRRRRLSILLCWRLNKGSGQA